MKATRAAGGMQKCLRKYFPQHVDTEVLPCPACGKEDLLWFGVESATTSGVGCYRCRLKVTRPWDDTAPRGWKKVDKEHDFDWLYIHYALKALVTWNKILRSEPCTPKNSKALPSPVTATSAGSSSRSTRTTTGSPSSSPTKKPANRTPRRR